MEDVRPRHVEVRCEICCWQNGTKKDHEVIGDVEEALEEVNEPDENVKTIFISSTSISLELKKQITSWWNKTSLTKRYLAKLVFTQVILILVIFCYLSVDVFSVRDQKLDIRIRLILILS